VPASGEVIGQITYKAGPALSELAKNHRKAGTMTLSMILKEKTGLGKLLSSHFSGLIREYAERGLIAESSRITSFWTETQSISFDDNARAEYLTEYFKKHAGRGLPEIIDVILATRVTGSMAKTAGVSPEALKEVKESVKTVKSKNESLERELNRLKTEVGNLKSTKGNPKGVETRTCLICGQKGHIAKDCPSKKKEGEQPKEDADEE